MRRKEVQKKMVNMRLRADLYDMLKKLAIDLHITSTDVIVQYLEYLQKSRYKHRLVLNENTETTKFVLAAGNISGLLE